MSFVKRLSMQVKPGKSDKNEKSNDRDGFSPSRESSPSSSGKVEAPSRASTSTANSKLLEQSQRSDSIDQHRGSRDLKSVPRALAGKFHLPGSGAGSRSPSRTNSDHDVPRNREGDPMSKNQIRKHEKNEEKEEKANWHDEQTKQLHKRREEQMKAADNVDPPEMREKYGWAPVNNYSGKW